MVKVLIVENEGLFRDMLKISLGAIPNIEIVDAVCDGNAAIQTTGQMRPDMGMILLSAHKEREYVSMIASDDMSGWSYVLKQSVTDADALVRAI